MYEYQSLVFVSNQIPQSAILSLSKFIKANVGAVEYLVVLDPMNTLSKSKRY